MSAKNNIVGKILASLVLVGSVILLVAGGIAWSTVSSELASQKIDVSAVPYELDGKEAPSDLTPRNANNPFDALNQIKLIQMHTSAAIEKMGFAAGTVYSEVPMPDSQELAACKAGTSDKSAADCAEMMKNDAARSFFDNSNNKQAALYTSVLAFGVSALVIGLGLLFALVGVLELMRSLAKPAKVATDSKPAEPKA